MGELTQAAEVYSAAPQHRTQQVWRALLSWLAFFFQIFFQIIRTLGHYPLLSLSSSNNNNTTSFKPLPSVELHDHDEQEQQLASAALDITAASVDYSPSDRLQRFTVSTQ